MMTGWLSDLIVLYKTWDGSLSYSGINKQAHDMYTPDRITPRTNCLVIRLGIYVDRAVDNIKNQTENRPLSYVLQNNEIFP